MAFFIDFHTDDYDYDYDYSEYNDYDYFESWELFKDSQFYEILNRRIDQSWDIFHRIQVSQFHICIREFLCQQNERLYVFIDTEKKLQKVEIRRLELICAQRNVFQQI